MTRHPLTLLERAKDSYGPGGSARKLALLWRLARTRLARARDVARLHEVLCFLRAYPDDARVLARVEQMLAGFGRRADLPQHRDALADTGIAGTAIHYRFFWPTARWLARRWPGQLALDRDDVVAGENIARGLPLLVTPGEAAWLREREVAGFTALDALRSRGETDAEFHLRRIDAMPGDAFTREAFHEANDVSYTLSPGSDTPSRTQARHAAAPAAFQAGSLRRTRPDLRTELGRPPRGVRELAPREGLKLVELARSAMVTRSRDLDAFSYGDPRDVRIVDDGDGLAFALNGVTPERRTLLPAVFGCLSLKNGVPLGYIQLDVLGRTAAISFNTFETFRGGESAWVFARMLAMTRYVFGATAFSIEPYQLGQGNDEGLDSGAWWFYYKMGFRPRAAGARGIVRRELARMRANSGYRSSRETLAALAHWHLYFDLDPGRPARLPPLADIGARVAARLAALGPDREHALAACSVAAMQRTGLRTLAGWSPGERLAWKRWSPLVLTLPGVSRWRLAERRALGAVIRAKGGRSENRFVTLWNAHPKLTHTLE